MYDQEYLVDGMNDDTSAVFIAPNLDKNLNSIDLPELHSAYREDEGEDEEE